MATTTPNLGLTKPAATDNVNIGVINDNMDILDTAIGKHRVTSSSLTSGSTQTITMQRGVVYVFRGSSSVAAVALIDQWSGVTSLHTNTNIAITCADHVVSVKNNGSAAANLFAIYTIS